MNENLGLPGTLNLAFVEGLYESYLQDPSSVPSDWQDYFRQIRNGDQPGRLAPDFPRTSIFNPAVSLPRSGRAVEALEAQSANLQDRVDQLIRAYRICGHLIAQIDPLGLPRPVPPEVDPAHYGFTAEDMERLFSCQTLHSKDFLTLREIIQRLRNT